MTGVVAELASGNKSSASILWLIGVIVILAVGILVRVLSARYRNRGRD